MDIVAVYWEQKIKTYGFHAKIGLCLFSVDLPADQLSHWEDRIDKYTGIRDFSMAFVQMTDDHMLRLHCLFDPAKQAARALVADRRISVLDENAYALESPVELVYFYGPHFGDRYGIADAAFTALEAQRLKILAASCTGASIYIVVPDKTAQAVIRCLSGSFRVPDTTI